MQLRADVLELNRRHFDARYAQADLAGLVEPVRNLEAFLARALEVDTSWRGLYQGGFVQQLQGRTVFEIGCGDGLNALVMAKLGAQVWACDIAPTSAALIRAAAAELGLTNIEPVTGDFTALDLPVRRFDFLIGKAFLHHLTHELEEQYLEKAARLLKLDGEARFFEPAVNSPWLDRLRWLIPVPGRPASWMPSFAAWKTNDPHPDRDNSATHFRQSGLRFFRQAEIVPLGSLERFCRLMPEGRHWRKRYRAWAHQTDEQLPDWFRLKAARSQLIRYLHPLN